MITKASARTNALGFFGLVLLSSLTMLWLFWHFPRGTGALALVVVVGLAVSARVTRWIDAEGLGPDARRLLADTETGKDLPQ